MARRPIPVETDTLLALAGRAQGMRVVREEGQAILWSAANTGGEMTVELALPDGADIAGFEAGARFLDLRDGLAPDKLTAETRATKLASAAQPEASLNWSTTLDGQYAPLWRYEPEPQWRDGERIGGILRWPEVDRRVMNLPPGTRKIYVRYAVKGMGLDSPRLALYSKGTGQRSNLEITHQWLEAGSMRQHVERIADPAAARSYTVTAGSGMTDHALILACIPVE
jgi:hypothetical protein